MTGIDQRRRFRIGSIESVTGWPGANSDDPPSRAPATIPGAKHQTGTQPGVFTFPKVGPMFLCKSNPSMRFAAVPGLEVKADASGRISGWGAVFGNVDSYGERVLPGAFRNSLAAHKARGTMPKMLWQHDPNKPIGRWEKAVEDGKGLFVEGVLNLKTTNGRDAYEHLQAGDVDGMSIGYREKQVNPNRDVRDLVELDLYEVSVVVFAANPEATVSSVKSKAELIDALRNTGLPKRAAELVAAGGWKALSKSNETDLDAVTRFAALIDDANRKLTEI